MKDIEAACHAIWGGAKLYVASDVPFFATKQGRTIGYSFAITAAIRRLTRAPMTLTGKPSVRALRFVARDSACRSAQLAVVGDDPVVEVLMARRAGATALAVTTGTTSREEWQRQPPSRRPHGILSDLRDVLEWVAATEEAASVSPGGARARARRTPSRGACVACAVPAGTAARCGPRSG